jgi:hypothetical protein
LKYEKLHAEYMERGLNYMIKHYVTRIPKVSLSVNKMIE